MSKKLAAINNHELWPLTAGEQARIMTLAARAGVKVARGKAVGKVDRAMERVWDDAAERVKAEEKAAEALRLKKVKDKATAKVERRAQRSWW